MIIISESTLNSDAIRKLFELISCAPSYQQDALLAEIALALEKYPEYRGTWANHIENVRHMM